VPFRRGIEAGAQAVMAAHVEMPALDPRPSMPATFSDRIVTDLLRTDLSFHGLEYTDPLSMDAVTRLASPDEAAGRAVLGGAGRRRSGPALAGSDCGVHRPEARAGGRAHQPGAAGRVGRACAAREGGARAARAAECRPGCGAHEGRRPHAPGDRARRFRAI